MSENKIEFTKENIDLYFRELSKEYKRLGGRNTPVEIVLIGGAAIRENEQNTQSMLIAFEEKYPGILGEGNVDSVIENAAEKSKDRVSVKAALEKLKKQRENGTI